MTSRTINPYLFLRNIVGIALFFIQSSCSSPPLHPAVTSPPSGAKRVLVVGLDADDCIFNYKYRSMRQEKNPPTENRVLTYIEEGDSKRKIFSSPIIVADSPVHKTMLVDSNQKLINHIQHKIDTQHYDTILFLIASARQSHFVDWRIAAKLNTALFFEAMPILVDSIKRCCRNVEFDPYLIADTDEELPSGTHFRNKDPEHACCRNMRFSHKGIIVERHKRYLEKRFPEHIIDYIVYDDQPDLYKGIKTKSGQVNFQLFLYKGDEPKKLEA